MTRREFEQALSDLPFGKRLPTAVYILREFVDLIGCELRAIIDNASIVHSIGPEYNVLKFNGAAFSVSFLSYPEFWQSPHPALVSALVVNLASGRLTRQEFQERSNPPILHRKEAFLPDAHPLRGLFTSLTCQEEDAGLYANTSTIGFRQNWELLLSAAGLSYEGHSLVKAGKGHLASANSKTHAAVISRHRTAIVRTDLSRPVKTGIETGLITPNQSFFDYGCGLGLDVDSLASMGYSSNGWDPVHRPDQIKTRSDVVNLGYVLNVIEDPAERVETLASAWDLCKSALVVTALTKGVLFSNQSTEYGDGVLTRRNTFQKLFDHLELQVLIEEALGSAAIPLGLGMFVVFREVSVREDFLELKTRRLIDWEKVARRLTSSPKRITKRDIYADHQELLDHLWAQTIELGRQPRKEEYERSHEVKIACGSLRAAQRIVSQHYGDDALNHARTRRHEDLTVYLALACFGGRRLRFNELSPRLRRSIEAFFGTYTAAIRQSTELLYSAGQTSLVEDAARGLKFGWFDSSECQFTCHRSLLESLPPLLRVYVGCGAQLYGDVREADLIKIHVRSQKLTCMFYEQFDRRRFPAQLLRVKIDFGRLIVREYDSSGEGNRNVLLFKERFLAKDHVGYDRMLAVSRRLRAMGLDEHNCPYGIERQRLDALLANGQ